VPSTTGIFIWATTVTNFLEDDPKAQFYILRSREEGDNIKGIDNLFSLYTTVIRASFRQILK